MWGLKKKRYDIKSGLHVTEWLTKDGFLHRSHDKPARIWDDGRQEWWVNGILHREGDKPAISQLNSDGTHLYEYYIEGKLHREGDKPAFCRYDGFLWRHEWYQHGLKHRDGDKPAVVHDYNSGKLKRIWFQHGRRHRENKPALTCVYPWGEMEEKWYYFGKVHRKYGLPAIVLTDRIGITEEQYFQHGEQYECIHLFGFVFSW